MTTTAQRRVSGNDSITIAKLIRNRIPFRTYGALQAGDLRWIGSGWLNDTERAAWHADYPDITYAVYSYGTPIAWVTSSGKTHRVAQKFSVTTSKHQGKLYYLEGEQ